MTYSPVEVNSNPDLSEQIDNALTQTLNNLFEIYSEQPEVLEYMRIQSQTTDKRSLLLVIDHNPTNPDSMKTIFGSAFNRGRFEKIYLEEYNNVTVKCFMTSQTFAQILNGVDKYGRAIDFRRLWATGELIYEGQSTYIHRELLEKMFMKFRSLLNMPDAARAVFR